MWSSRKRRRWRKKTRREEKLVDGPLYSLDCRSSSSCDLPSWRQHRFPSQALLRLARTESLSPPRRRQTRPRPDRCRRRPSVGVVVSGASGTTSQERIGSLRVPSCCRMTLKTKGRKDPKVSSIAADRTDVRDRSSVVVSRRALQDGRRCEQGLEESRLCLSGCLWAVWTRLIVERRRLLNSLSSLLPSQMMVTLNQMFSFIERTSR
jgi:hypothetical protein